MSLLLLLYRADRRIVVCHLVSRGCGMTQPCVLGANARFPTVYVDTSVCLLPCLVQTCGCQVPLRLRRARAAVAQRRLQHTHAHTYTHTPTPTQTEPHTHTHIHTYTPTHPPTHPHKHRLTHTHTHTQTHTLDKNGSLYDPAGTESWNMQIRYETTKLTMHPTNNRSSPEWFPCPRSSSKIIYRRRSFDKIIQIHRRHGFGEIFPKNQKYCRRHGSAKILRKVLMQLN